MKWMAILIATSTGLLFNAYARETFGVKLNVRGENNCKVTPQVFISKNKILLYQFEVPVGGTFDLNLLSGQYQFFAANQENCEVRLDVMISKKNKKISLNLKKRRNK